MTQLIENKPRRPALIATLLHFSNRLRSRLEFAVTACKQKTECISNRRKSAILSSLNIRVLRLALTQRSKEELLTAPSSLKLPASSIENLIDTACQLEMNLTPAKSTQIPFLIVAEMRFSPMKNRPQNRTRARAQISRALKNVAQMACALKNVAQIAPAPGGSLWTIRREGGK